MKKVSALLFAILLAGCSCKKPVEYTTIALSNTKCPEKSTCTIALLKNTALMVTSDNFGKPYYELQKNTAKSVIKFQIQRGKEQDLPDSGYREEVIFEVDAAIPDLTLSGLALQNTNMLYGRFCFCRGATGYYKISDGNLSIRTEKDHKVLRLDFKTADIPQSLSRIEAIIK